MPNICPSLKRADISLVTALSRSQLTAGGADVNRRKVRRRWRHLGKRHQRPLFKKLDTSCLCGLSFTILQCVNLFPCDLKGDLLNENGPFWTGKMYTYLDHLIFFQRFILPVIVFQVHNFCKRCIMCKIMEEGPSASGD